MASSSQNSEIYDPVRNIWVAPLPEEIVRQKLIQKMIHVLGFPKGHLAVEKELKELPHLKKVGQLPDRRIDIVCYAPSLESSHPLSPLLLIECKHELVSSGALEQLEGYNAFVKAPFLAVADGKTVCFCYRTHEGVKQLPYLPTYKELIDALRR